MTQLSTNKTSRILLLLSLFFVLFLLAAQVDTSPRNASPSFSAPVLKWQRGGCYNSWCETGWYSSPATADLDKDGQVEVIASAYSIFVLNGATGALEWKVSSGHDRSEPNASNAGRTWPGIVVADIDQDGSEEIATAHSGGWVSIYNAQGYFEANWPQRPSDHELRGLSASDLDADGKLELIVTAALGSRTNTWVYEPDGTLRPGWPQLNNDSGYAWGVYNANAAVGDLDDDGHNEIVVPSDVHYICAYEANGTQIPANDMYGSKAWGKVGVWESLEPELRGWGECNGVRTESYRTNFADGPSVIADVNGDGVNEIIVTGNTYDCSTDPYSSKYDGVFIFNGDRSRFNDGPFDWQTVPIDTGAPLAEDYNLIESAQPNPTVADLEADGYLEIIYASYDGRLHAFWLDKSEHGSWPYSVTLPGEGFIRFASEPVIADLDNNGLAEVIFSSWTQKGSYHTGKLHILDYLGNPVYEVDLPEAFGGADWNGALPAPTLANIDSDADLEVILLTANSGVVAFDLPGTESAVILWGTGRGDYQRDGYLENSIRPSLSESTKAASSWQIAPGEVYSYTITLRNSGQVIQDASITDSLPARVTYAGNLWASSGSASYAGGIVSWNGPVGSGTTVVIQFEVVMDGGITQPEIIKNSALAFDGLGHSWQLDSTIYVLSLPVFLPEVRK